MENCKELLNGMVYFYIVLKENNPPNFVGKSIIVYERKDWKYPFEKYVHENNGTKPYEAIVIYVGK